MTYVDVLEGMEERFVSILGVSLLAVGLYRCWRADFHISSSLADATSG